MMRREENKFRWVNNQPLPAGMKQIIMTYDGLTGELVNDVAAVKAIKPDK